MLDDPIRVRFFRAAVATPVEEEDDNGSGKNGNASSNSTSNRAGIATFRTRWASRHNDNRRFNGGGDYQAIGFCLSEEKIRSDEKMRLMMKYICVHEFRRKYRSQCGGDRRSTRALCNLIGRDCEDIRSDRGCWFCSSLSWT